MVGVVTTGSSAGTIAVPGGGSGTAVMPPRSEEGGEVSAGGTTLGIAATPDVLGVSGGTSEVLGAGSDPAALSGPGGATCAVARLRRA